MENKNYSTVFEADLAYLRSLGDTSECKTEFEVRLKTLRKLGGDIQTTTPLLYEIEKKILDFLGGDSSLYDNIYFVRKAIAERQGVNTEGLHTIYAIAVASLNSKPVDIKYTITFKNYDGTILETQSLSLNEMPVYTGETPVKPSDEEYNYTFNGWLPEISPVSGNAEYVAQFEATAIPVNTNYVTFTAEEANSTIGLNKLSTNQTLEYSTDTTNWNTMDTSTSISLPNTGDEVYIRGILSADNSASDYTQFKMTGKIAASGNCNAIWNYQDIEAPLKKYCGRSMFYNCKLTKAPELPATELANYCYNQMFIYCSTLTTAPELPATTLAPYCYTNMFQSCTSLVEAPSILPATELVTYCYNQMFNGCTKLTTAPILPATTLAQFCYDNMFQSCTSLVEAPSILPATTLANYCYSSMFYGCTSLKTAPELPATTLAPSCYSSMFQGCTSLKTAPELPATTLAPSCYSSMFSGCSSLTTAPELPATTLKNNCYEKMFRICSSLVEAPELPATELANRCYYEMFVACTKLNKITCLATDISATSCTQGWLANVPSTGTFIKNPNMNDWTTGNNGIPSGWTVEDYGESDEPDLTLPYVTFTAEEANSTIGLKRKYGQHTLEYSTDTTNWNTMNTSTTITLANTGDKVYVRGILSANISGYYTQFKMTGKIAASGNCNAIWNYEDLNAPLKARCGYAMFSDCTALTTAPELPATELSESCYYYMFSDCSALTTAPELPATTLSESCYSYMFDKCTSLTTAPELPATELAYGCYTAMFYNCKLTTAPELPATELAQFCYQFMFNKCTALTTAPELPATELSESCYWGMFSGCSALTTAPELPATELASSCYKAMFYNCTSLTSAPELPATELATGCYEYMFSKCTSLTVAPELPATTLAEGCYQNMFNGCTSLNKITCLATDISATDCTTNWVNGVTSTGTFIKNPDMNDWTSGVNGIPENWQVENYGESDVPYVTFAAEEAGSTVGLSRISPNQTLEYSTDTTNWNTMDTSTNITLANTGDKVYVRGILSADNTIEAPTQFRITGWVAASGNCNAIWNYQDLNAPLKEYCGSEMFKECSLIKAPELPATELAYGCYREMFRGCSPLTEAPELPATTLADYCYKNMFVQSGLEKSPILPATTLVPYCYDSMFVMCQFLSEVTCLATDISATSCTGSWLEGAAGAGTFIKDPNMEWTRGSGGIPIDWTVEDYVG